MANSQPLSPQGYNIKDKPINTNPFWGGEEPIDPSVYVRLDQLEEAVEDLDDDKVDYTYLIDNYYNQTYIDNQLSTKANISAFNNYYTKNEVDALLPNMTNYYTKSQVYNKSEIDATLGNIQSLLEAI